MNTLAFRYTRLHKRKMFKILILSFFLGLTFGAPLDTLTFKEKVDTLTGNFEFQYNSMQSQGASSYELNAAYEEYKRQYGK